MPRHPDEGIYHNFLIAAVFHFHPIRQGEAFPRQKKKRPPQNGNLFGADSIWFSFQSAFPKAQSAGPGSGSGSVPTMPEEVSDEVEGALGSDWEGVLLMVAGSRPRD